MNEALVALAEQFSALRKAIVGIASVAKARGDSTGLEFACHMLIDAFGVYETEVVKFVSRLEKENAA